MEDYVITHNGPIGTTSQQSTAAAFYARHKGKTNNIKILMQPNVDGPQSDKKPTDFAGLLSSCPPVVPSHLLKRMDDKEECNTLTNKGKVRVILKVADDDDKKEKMCFHFDKKKRQVTLVESQQVSNATEIKDERKINVSAPKMFAFDGIFEASDDNDRDELNATALADAVSSVITARTDACLFSFGHSRLGKSHTMIGGDGGRNAAGLIPTAAAWLFRCIKERRDKTNARFSIRVSAMEITRDEEVRDLLIGQNEGVVSHHHATQAPSALLPRSSASTSVLENLSELRCPNAEKAGLFLDLALAARRATANTIPKLNTNEISSKENEAAGSSTTNSGQQRNSSPPSSHFVFTLHVYQYSVEAGAANSSPVHNNGSSSVLGGRSRLHLIDFGSCERTKNTANGGVTLSALGHIILGIFNGQRQLPFRESPVTLLLKECLGSLSCQAVMLAHVSPRQAHYSETLHTTQLASRIHRMRRKKPPTASGKTAAGSTGSGGSSDEMKHRRLIKLKQEAEFTASSTATDPSSSEQSCDTVIYVGDRGADDDEGTDCEHPPVYLPHLNAGDNRGLMSQVLRGSLAEPKQKSRSRSSTLEKQRRKSPGSSSAGYRHHQGQLPVNNMRLRPGSVGSTPTRFMHSPARSHGSLPRKGKMPLTGRVAGNRQISQTELWVDHPPQQQYVDYGYMDEHKKFMIQQWVECQTHQMQQQKRQRRRNSGSGERMIPVQAPPEISSPQSHKSSLLTDKMGGEGGEPEPFAWLRERGDGTEADDPRCRVLTHFKTAESSEEESAEKAEEKQTAHQTTVVDVHVDESKIKDSVPPSPAVSSDKEDGISAELRLFCGKKPADFYNLTKKGEETEQGGQELSGTTTSNIKEESLQVLSADQGTPLTHHSAAFTTTTACPSNNNNNRLKSISTSVPPKEEGQEELPATLNPKRERRTGDAGHCTEEEYLFVEQSQNGKVQYVGLSSGLPPPPPPAISIPDTDVDLPFPSPPPGLSPVAELTGESSNNSEKSEENSMDPANLSQLDSTLLHYVRRRQRGLLGDERNFGGLSLDEFACVSEDACLPVEKRFDQLAKLHDLYASVSSISAKSQSHLDEKQQLRETLGGSTFSLGVLQSQRNESDLNSLCSEPAKLIHEDSSTTQSQLDLNDAMALCDVGFNSISLSDLGFACSTKTEKESQPQNGVKARSDSPVLESIDRELAKYAKLKDLKQVYHVEEEEASQFPPSPPSHIPPSSSYKSREEHVPDGASTPEQNIKPAANKSEESSLAVIPRRSPGTGQSSSDDPDEVKLKLNSPRKTIVRKHCNSPAKSLSPRTATVSKQRLNCHVKNEGHQETRRSSSDERKTPKTSGKNANKVPRFSRLLSSASKKISRSPLKITTSSSNKKRTGEQDKRGQKTVDVSREFNNDQQNKRKYSLLAFTEGSSIPDRKTSTLPSRGKKRTERNHKKMESKNVVSSPPFTTKTRAAERAGGSIVGILPKEAVVIPSPYSFPSAPARRRSRAGGETSSNDSGFGHPAAGRTTAVRMRMATESLSASRAAHCRSSGYESSAADSLESPTAPPPHQDAAKQSYELTLSADLNRLPPAQIVKYSRDDVARLDRQWRKTKVNELRSVQERLKGEMDAAKERIAADPSKWSYELHLKECPEEGTTSSFVEALAKETMILGKRVDACKSHVSMETCFDRDSNGIKDGSSAKCDNVVQQPGEKTETDLV